MVSAMHAGERDTPHAAWRQRTPAFASSRRLDSRSDFHL